jgi:aminoglycoside 3-N-acetyltransferase
MTQINLRKNSKKILKTMLNTSRRSYVRAFRSFDTADFRDALRDLGVATGQALMVHSSYDAFEGFTGKPTDVLATLEDLVGREGTILMPSMPFDGTAVAYVRSGKITDIGRTPSRMGMLTELFRRQKGTLRSLHPTHPILARGAKAAAMLADHARATTPCGAYSPFAKLVEEHGKVLLLGTDIESMTLFHYLEELFEDRLDPSPFTTEFFDAQVKSGSDVATVRTRLFDMTLSRRRAILPLLPALRRSGGCASGRVGTVDLLLVDAGAATAAFASCLEKGINFYAER